ncbi:hypothetical protein IOC57_12130 [Bacillus sp. SD075]|nr:hypothetical protein [Bacillus sp. SD075]
MKKIPFDSLKQSMKKILEQPQPHHVYTKTISRTKAEQKERFLREAGSKLMKKGPTKKRVEIQRLDEVLLSAKRIWIPNPLGFPIIFSGCKFIKPI